MDLRKVKKLIELVEESGIREIEEREHEHDVLVERVQDQKGDTDVVPAPMDKDQLAGSPLAPINGHERQETNSADLSRSQTILLTMGAHNGKELTLRYRSWQNQ